MAISNVIADTHLIEVDSVIVGEGEVRLVVDEVVCFVFLGLVDLVESVILVEAI